MSPFIFYATHIFFNSSQYDMSTVSTPTADAWAAGFRFVGVTALSLATGMAATPWLAGLGVSSFTAGALGYGLAGGFVGGFAGNTAGQLEQGGFENFSMSEAMAAGGEDAVWGLASMGIFKVAAMRPAATAFAAAMLYTSDADAGVWDTVVKRGMSTLRTGNRIMQRAGRTMHFPAGTSDAAAQRMLTRADALGDELQMITSRASAAWRSSMLSRQARYAVRQAYAAGKPWQANLLRMEAKGRWVHQQVRDAIREAIQAGDPLYNGVRYNRTGVDVLGSGRRYEILSLSNWNVRQHAARMSSIDYRLIGF